MAYYLTNDELYHSLIQSQKYGVPEQKKFPLFDLDHVKSAIKFFNYVDPKYEDQLAKAILRRAKEYGLDLSEMSIGDNNRFKKYLPNDELKHHGILGQKWGVRRYQNEDGSYTEAGKKRRITEYNSLRNKKIKNGDKHNIKNINNRYLLVEDIRKNVLTEDQKKELEKIAFKRAKQEIIANNLQAKLVYKYTDLDDHKTKYFKDQVWWKSATSKELGEIDRARRQDKEYKEQIDDKVFEIVRNLVAEGKKTSEMTNKEWSLIKDLTEDLSEHYQVNINPGTGYTDAWKIEYAKNRYNNALKAYNRSRRTHKSQREIDDRFELASLAKMELDEIQSTLKEKYK